jgi:HAD superfamily hydrolase (TIGR01509 family)
MAMVKAVIFDFDGVLFDTEPLHFDLFRDVLRTEGITLTSDTYHAAYVGLTDEACFRAVLTDYGKTAVSTAMVDRLVHCKTDLMQRALHRMLPVLPGVMEFIRDVQATHRLAIASGALRQEIVLCLELGGMTSMFEQVSAAQDVRQGKPDPALYLHALDVLDRRSPLRAEECVAIEDTPHGIEAAHKAGMRCVGVATTLPAHRLAQADLVIPSLQAVPAEALFSQLPG